MESKYTEWMFGYQVYTTDTNVMIAEVSFPEEMTPEQAGRLKASFESGKYRYLEEDASIADIYGLIYDEAIQIEQQQEYGELVGTKILPKCFRYPEELYREKEDSI